MLMGLFLSGLGENRLQARMDPDAEQGQQTESGVRNSQLLLNYRVESKLPELDLQDQSPESSEEEKMWDLMVYRGQFSDTDLQSILLKQETDYQPSFITVFAMNRKLDESLLGFKVESEGQFVVHSGRMSHLEYNGLFVFRSRPFESLPLSFAFGEGLSVATQNPGLENQRKSWQDPNRESEYSKKLLNYLLFEVDYAIPGDVYNPRVFMRVHHRSGIYGIFCPPTCGSNFVAYGVKVSY